MNKLAAVIIHYHLRPGGVTRVIERAVDALADQVDVLVLSGEAPAPGEALTPITQLFPALAYADQKMNDAEQQVEELRRVARHHFGRDPDLWHIHNHALGKNAFTAHLTWHLANAGCRLLLQPHDFAEDGRPNNYRLLKHYLGERLETMLYPTADHIWYAPINYRDKTFLEAIGLSNVHELPNTVTPHQLSARTAAPAAEEPSSGRTVVYPARAIRRKNLGEFVLWSLLAPSGCTFQSTLAPQNPAWQKYYHEWVRFARELKLPIEFDAGRKHDFSELVQQADALISTSIAEGFGLAFLEPWLEGKNLVGRNLPEITADFEADGLDLSSLYSTLPVPLEWAGEGEFYQALECAMEASYAAYSKPWKNAYFEQAKAALVIDGKVDFGILDEVLQRKVIRHLVSHPAERDLLPPFHVPTSPSRIANNREVVREHYSPEAYGERLHGMYRTLADTEPGRVTSADAARLLDTFLQPHRFNLLRT